MAMALADMMDRDIDQDLFTETAHFAGLLRAYFDDPTAYLLEWLRGRE
jgi:hypothetical protein